MTVSYSFTAATASSLTQFRLLTWWKGSVWKLVWLELLIWFIITLSLSLCTYFFIIDTSHQPSYQMFIMYVRELPMKSAVTVLLSFTTTTSIARWMAMYRCLLWPDNTAHLLNSLINDSALSKENNHRLKTTVSRYLTLSYILLLRDVSVPMRKRFPTYEHLIKEGEGIMTQTEHELMCNAKINDGRCRYWIPLLWIALIVKQKYKPGQSRKGPRHQKNGSIMDEYQYMVFIQEVERLRSVWGDVLAYDWVPIPLAMTQILTAAVYVACIIDAFAIQKPLFEEEGIHLLIAIVMNFTTTFLMNIFLMGWLKCSEVILNPFGTDDDDFEIDWLLDRHLKVLSSIFCQPVLVPNPNVYAVTCNLPHTVASALISRMPDAGFAGSMANDQVKSKDQGQIYVH